MIDPKAILKWTLVLFTFESSIRTGMPIFRFRNGGPPPDTLTNFRTQNKQPPGKIRASGA